MKGHLDFLRKLPTRLAAIPPAFEREVLDIKNDTRFAEHHKQELISQARAAAMQQVDGLHQKALAAEQGLRQQIATALNVGPESAEAALARELATGRAWKRAERELESGVDVISLVQDAGERGDAIALRAMREELPSFLKLRGQRPMVKPVLDLIDRLEIPLLTPEQRAARGAEQEITNGMPQLLSAVEFIRYAVGGQSVTVIPGWEYKQAIYIKRGGE